MGTRADFYVGTGPTAEWLGSIAYDGYRIDEMKAAADAKDDEDRASWAVKSATDETGYRRAVAALLAVKGDATLPEQGWPWPWIDSHTTDYAYAFVDGACKTFPWGKGVEWPDMTARQNVTFGDRSGIMLLVGK